MLPRPSRIQYAHICHKHIARAVLADMDMCVDLISGKDRNNLTCWIWESMWCPQTGEMHDSAAFCPSSLPSVLDAVCVCVCSCAFVLWSEEEDCVSLQGFGPGLHVSSEDEHYMPLICLIFCTVHAAADLSLSLSLSIFPLSLSLSIASLYYLKLSLQFPPSFFLFFFFLPCVV